MESFRCYRYCPCLRHLFGDNDDGSLPWLRSCDLGHEQWAWLGLCRSWAHNLLWSIQSSLKHDLFSSFFLLASQIHAWPSWRWWWKVLSCSLWNEPGRLFPSLGTDSIPVFSFSCGRHQTKTPSLDVVILETLQHWRSVGFTSWNYEEDISKMDLESSAPYPGSQAQGSKWSIRLSPPFFTFISHCLQSADQVGQQKEAWRYQ